MKRQPRKPQPPAFTLASRLLAAGQRLRATETATATTFALRYAAARQGGAR
jgi:hypothetical protein